VRQLFILQRDMRAPKRNSSSVSFERVSNLEKKIVAECR
jgi:hypothetical protein